MNDLPAQPERLEQIVAYLDGELPPGESAEVERRLAADEAFRQELQAMERAWTALDALPRATVSDKFSQTTMEMAVSAAREEVAQKSGQATGTQGNRPRRWPVAMFCGGAAAVVLGFLLARGLASDPNRELLAALPVIRNVDLYAQLKGTAEQEAQFLKQLAPHRASLATPAVQSEIQTTLQATRELETSAGRRQWLRELPDEQRTTLLYKARRYRDLSPAERTRITELHATIAGHQEADLLRATLESYGHWLGNLPQGEQFELRQMPVDERVRQIRTLIREQGNDQRFALNEEQLRRLAQVFAQSRKEAGWMFADIAQRGHRDRVSPAERTRAMAAIHAELEAGDSPRSRVYRAVQEALPEEVRAEFKKLSLLEQLHQLRNWQRQIRAQAGEVSQQELERFFAEELDASTREELLRLSPEDMRQRLRRLYHRLPADDRDLGFGPPAGPPPRGGGRGGEGRRGGFGRPGPGPPPDREPPRKF